CASYYYGSSWFGYW
nr:immunoglobulin heavy chain junction region [Mus musculus]